MRSLLALMWNGFREARRNRVTVVVFGFAFVMIFSATIALELTVATFERVMTDLGLGVMSLISTFLTIFLGSGLLPREIERRTIFMVLAKPISRWVFLVGRYLANVLTVVFVLAVMAVLFILQLVVEGVPLSAPQFVSLAGMVLQVLVLTAITFAFGARSSQLVTAVASTGLYFIGHLARDLYILASKATEPVASIGKVIYFIIPHLDRLDFKARATYGEVTTLAELGGATAYAVAYSVAMLVLASLTFERRDFK